MFKINLKGVEPQWYDFPENEPQCRLKIRPYPKSRGNTILRKSDMKSDAVDMVLPGRDQKDAFMYCLMDAENLTDDAGKAMKLTEKVKEALFDYEAHLKTSIPAFVLQKSKALEAAREDEEKN